VTRHYADKSKIRELKEKRGWTYTQAREHLERQTTMIAAAREMAARRPDPEWYVDHADECELDFGAFNCSCPQVCSECGWREGDYEGCTCFDVD